MITFCPLESSLMLLIATNFSCSSCSINTQCESHMCRREEASFSTLATANCGSWRKDSRADEVRPQTADYCIPAGYFFHLLTEMTKLSIHRGLKCQKQPISSSSVGLSHFSAVVVIFCLGVTKIFLVHWRSTDQDVEPDVSVDRRFAVLETRDACV